MTSNTFHVLYFRFNLNSFIQCLDILDHKFYQHEQNNDGFSQPYTFTNPFYQANKKSGQYIAQQQYQQYYNLSTFFITNIVLKHRCILTIDQHDATQPMQHFMNISTISKVCNIHLTNLNANATINIIKTNTQRPKEQPVGLTYIPTLEQVTTPQGVHRINALIIISSQKPSTQILAYQNYTKQEVILTFYTNMLNTV
eukprot:TRINITY_DN3888_c0_g1_i2.p2 TRINITY_DN3888_c0_g1~~TRINITY_DN3888_c0_g1_i2.p2  ORF type:complete len:198 (-),score=-13.80 TRINITY_DN3888_c0_g1_i2:318-911(-)